MCKDKKKQLLAEAKKEDIYFTNETMYRLIAMMKNKMIALLFVAFGISNFYACAQTKTIYKRVTSYQYIDLATMNEQILKLVNEHRKSIGKGALQMTDAASAQALQHSIDMMKGRTPFGHEGFDNRVDAVKKTIGFINAAAENVAYGQMSAEEVVDGWLHSPGHKTNIEGDYNLTGIGISQNSNGVIYFTQIFVLKK